MINKHKLPWKGGEKTIVNRFVQALEPTCGITEQMVFDRRQECTNINDALWSLCNEYLLKNQKTENFENLQAIYYQMERILVSEGKNANKTVKKRLYYVLQDFKKQGVPIVIPVCTENSCKACKELDGKEFDIDEAIEKQPLPPKDCTCQRCECQF